jgi:predicted Zn finger-like uncharacterized protein
MRVECPNCEAGIHLAEAPDDDTPVKCPKCKARFTLEDDEDDDRPAPKSKKGGGKKKKGKGDDEKKFPVIPVVGGGIAVLAIVGVVIGVLATRKSDPPKNTDTASNTSSDTE